MQNFNEIVLVGYSGHSYVICEAALLSNISIHGYVDSHKNIVNPYGLKYLGSEKNGTYDWNFAKKYIVAIGNNAIRASLAFEVKKYGGECLTIVHPDATVSQSAHIGSGTFIARNAAINPLARVGSNVIVNTSSSLDHECVIGDHAHIGPGAVLAGNVCVGSGAFIGANAVIREGIKIGKNAIIGAGAVVLKDVAPAKTIVGNPGRLIK